MSLGSTSALPPCQPAAPCTPCIFGAATSLHSFPYQVETVTVEVIPIVTALRNGSLETSYVTSTLTDSITGSQLPGPQITDPSSVTWTILGSVVLTSPTTYVEYTDFYGAPGNVAPITQTSAPGAASTCAHWSDVRTISAPPNVDHSPLIVPLAANASVQTDFWAANLVPPQILDFLEGSSWITSVMGQDDLAVCSAIDDTPPPQTTPAACTTESVSTITTCIPTTRLNMTMCVNTTVFTIVTLDISSKTTHIAGAGSATSAAQPTAAPLSSHPAPIYASTSLGDAEPAPTVGTARTDHVSASFTIDSTPVSHATAHLLTTITQTPITRSPGFIVSDKPSLDSSPFTGTNTPGGQDSLQMVSPSVSPQAPGSGDQPPLQSDQLAPVAPTSPTQTLIVVGSQTVLPGGAVTRDGTTISYAPTGGTVYVNGHPTPISGPALTIGSDVISAVPTVLPPDPEPELVGGLPPASPVPELVGGTQTLAPGQALTLAGTTLSLPATPRGTVFVNGEPVSLSGPVLTVAGTPFTLTTQVPAIPGVGRTVTGLVGDGQTILPGQVVTTDGATVSLPVSAGTVFVNGRPSVISDSTVVVGSEVFSVFTSVEFVTTAPGPGDGGAVFRASATGGTSRKNFAGRGEVGQGWGLVYAIAVVLIGTGMVLL